MALPKSCHWLRFMADIHTAIPRPARENLHLLGIIARMSLGLERRCRYFMSSLTWAWDLVVSPRVLRIKLFNHSMHKKMFSKSVRIARGMGGLENGKEATPKWVIFGSLLSPPPTPPPQTKNEKHVP